MVWDEIDILCSSAEENATEHDRHVNKGCSGKFWDSIVIAAIVYATWTLMVVVVVYEGRMLTYRSVVGLFAQVRQSGGG